MNYSGVLKKMKTDLGDQVDYFIEFKEDFIHVNQLINKTVKISHDGYECTSCGKDKKIFAQGFCYECFSAIPQAGEWIMKPELSTAHLDIEDRNLEYEKEMQLQDHIVYLAQSSHVKVGVTRKKQLPTRWIDQGATQALVFLEVPNRYLAGVAEVALKQYLSDKTHWQKMLKEDKERIDLIAIKEEHKSILTEELQSYYQKEHEVIQINYPVLSYPEKVKSTKLDKYPSFEKKLVGVKGQYLIFEDGSVFNVRNHEGFVVTITV